MGENVAFRDTAFEADNLPPMRGKTDSGLIVLSLKFGEPVQCGVVRPRAKIFDFVQGLSANANVIGQLRLSQSDFLA